MTGQAGGWGAGGNQKPSCHQGGKAEPEKDTTREQNKAEYMWVGWDWGKEVNSVLLADDVSFFKNGYV